MEQMESGLWIRAFPSGSGSESGQEIKIFGSEVRQPILNHAETDPEYRGKPTNFILKGILAWFVFNQAFAPWSGAKIQYVCLVLRPRKRMVRIRMRTGNERKNGANKW